LKVLLSFICGNASYCWDIVLVGVGRAIDNVKTAVIVIKADKIISLLLLNNKSSNL
jgi:hypothetical protein